MSHHTGLVVKKRVAVGSKSDHTAVVLETPGGDLRIRRVGANPFRDPALEVLVGRTVSLDGRVEGATLFVSKLPPAENTNGS